MDNLCHALAGVALAESGIAPARRRTVIMAALAANAPDIDAFVALTGYGPHALEFRRGITHGILALVVLPPVIAWLTWLVGRRTDDVRKLLLLAALAVWSHSFLDWLNSYGIRLLAPFDGRWFYGDAVFIIDPWIWLTLGAGAVVAWRRRRRGQPVRALRAARVALTVVGVYIASMLALTQAGRSLVQREVAASGRRPAERLMVAPRPLTPFVRDVIRDVGPGYETGTLIFFRKPSYRRGRRYLDHGESPQADAARLTPDGRAFLTWSRFPMFDWDVASPNRVAIYDVRYAERGGGGRGWATVTVDVRDRR